ncbi:MAG: acyl-CoA dehydrogenase family protein [Microthrixaceae bacterium]
MELELSEDQEFFQQTTRKFLTAESPLTTVRSLESNPAGFDSDYWRRGAELGWTSMLVPESEGGGSLSEHGLLDLVLVAEEMGRLVAPGPLVPVNVVASTVARSGSAAQKAEVLPGLLDGSRVAAWATTTNVCEPPRPDGGGEGSQTLVASGSGYVLDGIASLVEAGAQAQHLLVSTSAPEGPTQVLVGVDTPGVTITALEGLDLIRRFAEVRFDRVALPASAIVGALGAAAGDIEHQLQVAVALQCAETVGAIDRMFEVTLEYLSDRYSFGRPLSSYQALKHRVADDKMWLEACQATATAAAQAVATEAPDADQLVSVAKAWIGPHATELIQDCVQLHGGIGVTWEHDLHLYLRRTTVNRLTYGTPEQHADRIATALLGAAS